MKTLQAWFDDIMQLHNQRIDLSLDRMRIVAERLQVLSLGCSVITVAGTNGKGSCATTLESIYHAAGYHVGCYTSPELIDFCERIRLNQQLVPESSLLKAFEQVECARGKTTLSFFEFTTLAALLIFAQASLDIVILEIGLGGRLDAVNVIDPAVSIITSIGLDHMEFLGSDRETIGREKAGIMRSGCPVICGDVDPPPSIKEVAQMLGAELLQIDNVFDYTLDDNTSSWLWQSQLTQYADLPVPAVRLDNASCALMAVECLQSQMPVHKQAIDKGLKSVMVPGRVEQHSVDGVSVILDVAHNPDAVKALIEQLDSLGSQLRFRAVFSCAEGKAIEEMIDLLSTRIEAWYVAPLFPSYSPGNSAPTGHSKVLTDALIARQCNYVICESVSIAFEQAKADVQHYEALLVLGSFKTVAAIKKSFLLQKDTVCPLT